MRRKLVTHNSKSDLPLGNEQKKEIGATRSNFQHFLHDPEQALFELGGNATSISSVSSSMSMSACCHKDKDTNLTLVHFFILTAKIVLFLGEESPSCHISVSYIRQLFLKKGS